VAAKDKNISPGPSIVICNGNAKALVAMAKLVQNDTLAQKYEAKATELRKLTIDNLWDEKASFFKVKLEKTNGFSDAREAIGFIPWYFQFAR